ncbi:hypothetical protein [Paenibacillus guangzhouensis]|uniref:hypothetical protein n=1 Tax=Paenibacillus guangzhouensis TaxID=1473112 RepID=UPI001266DFF3|nr:hypothetical protein [Paenibacillus guangzhouensis]
MESFATLLGGSAAAAFTFKIGHRANVKTMALAHMRVEGFLRFNSFFVCTPSLWKDPGATKQHQGRWV